MKTLKQDFLYTIKNSFPGSGRCYISRIYLHTFKHGIKLSCTHRHRVAFRSRTRERRPSQCVLYLTVLILFQGSKNHIELFPCTSNDAYSPPLIRPSMCSSNGASLKTTIQCLRLKKFIAGLQSWFSAWFLVMVSLTYISANKEPNIGGCLSRRYVFQNQPSTYHQDSDLA